MPIRETRAAEGNAALRSRCMFALLALFSIAIKLGAEIAAQPGALGVAGGQDRGLDAMYDQSKS